jgi:hypothetical protein
MKELMAGSRPELDGEEIRAIIGRLRARMRRANDPDPLHLEFIEDDLREGGAALEEVEAFFADVLRLLSSPEARAADLVDLADDTTVLDRLDYLVVVVNNLRRRLMHIAQCCSN